jgi:putative flippase GtrA
MTPPPATTYSESIVGHDIHVVDAPLSRRLRWSTYGAQAIRFIRFAIVGGLASIVYLSLFAILVTMGVHYLAAGVIGYLTAIVTNFSLNREWTFGRGSRRVQHQAAAFLVVQLVIGAVNLSLLHVLVVGGLRPIILAQLLAAGCLVPVNFLASQRWGFR